jgi:hemin uptake protein HemP
MADKADDDHRSEEDRPPAKTPRTISSREILRGEKLVIVQHEQENYRLQVTASGKLILTK